MLDPELPVGKPTASAKPLEIVSTKLHTALPKQPVTIGDAAACGVDERFDISLPNIFSELCRRQTAVPLDDWMDAVDRVMFDTARRSLTTNTVDYRADADAAVLSMLDVVDKYHDAATKLEEQEHKRGDWTMHRRSHNILAHHVAACLTLLYVRTQIPLMATASVGVSPVHWLKDHFTSLQPEAHAAMENVIQFVETNSSLPPMFKFKDDQYQEVAVTIALADNAIVSNREKIMASLGAKREQFEKDLERWTKRREKSERLVPKRPRKSHLGELLSTQDTSPFTRPSASVVNKATYPDLPRLNATQAQEEAISSAEVGTCESASTPVSPAC